MLGLGHRALVGGSEELSDLMEAMALPPMGDVSVRGAQERWPEKALWTNFTRSMHIQSPEVIEAHTRQLLKEDGGQARIRHRRHRGCARRGPERSLAVISRVLEERGSWD